MQELLIATNIMFAIASQSLIVARTSIFATTLLTFAITIENLIEKKI